MPEKTQFLLKSLKNELNRSHMEKVLIQLPTKAKQVFKARIKVLNVNTKPGKRSIQVGVITKIQIYYIEAETTLLKFTEKVWNFSILIPRTTLDDCFITRLDSGSILHIAFISPDSVYLDAQLQLRLIMYKEEIRHFAQWADNQAQVQVTKAQTHVIPSLGTIHIEVD